MATHDDEQSKIPHEREHFTTLLAKNANYFGTLAETDLEPVKAIKGNTTYEELTCVGLSTGFDRLEAIVQVKLGGGYGGGMCNGSVEYVRFFVDLHDNGVWHDVGVASVAVHDIPGKKPLCYGVHLDFTPFKRFCKYENIVKVRAVLQWNAPPSSNPSAPPVWGNVVDVQVQIRPTLSVPLGDIIGDLELAEVALPDPIGPIIAALDPSSEIPVAPALTMTLDDRKALYARKKVPSQRFAFPDVHKLVAYSEAGGLASLQAGALSLLELSEAEISSILDAIAKPTGNTSYEELRCIGLEPEAGLLEGVVTIKRPYGYGGHLCAKGTREYVAFWIDFGAGWDYMGTSTINVHDLATIPDEDVQYAVFLKKDLNEHQIVCEKGAKVVKLRAILSWEHPPTNPNYIPTWGNRKDCLIQLRPGTTTGHEPWFEAAGGVALPAGIAGDGRTAGGDRPFGGAITIAGRIGNPPDTYGGGAAPLRYRIEVSGPPPFSAWQSLAMGPFDVTVSRQIGGTPVLCPPGYFLCPHTLTPVDYGDGHGAAWYPYVEDLNGNETRQIWGDTLATWNTAGLKEGLWTMRMIVKDPVTLAEYTSPSAVVRLHVDNTWPTGPAGPGASPAAIAAMPPLQITGATFNGAPIPALDCGRFPVGTIIKGKFEVHDPAGTLVGDPSVTAAELLDNQHFHDASLTVYPAILGNVANVVTTPASPSYPIVATDGVAGTWTLDTSQMAACGYIIRLVAHDRAIVDSWGGFAHELIYDVGFCLI